MARWALQDQLVRLDLRARRGLLEHKDLPVRRGRRVILARWELLARPALQVQLGRKEQLGLRGLKETPVLRARLVRSDLWVRRGPPVQPGQSVLKGQRETQGQLVRLERRVLPVP